VGWIVGGVLVALFGLFVTLGGAVVTLVDKTVSSLDPIAEARTPGTATFVAEDAEYEVLSVRRRTDSARGAEDFECEVTLADGRTISLDGSVQAVSVAAANTETIGSFDAVAGETAVFCDADGGDNRFVVDKRGALGRWGMRLLLSGVVVLLAGTGMLLGGIFWKKPPRASDSTFAVA
jgi:hypothetical protein